MSERGAEINRIWLNDGSILLPNVSARSADLKNFESRVSSTAQVSNSGSAGQIGPATSSHLARENMKRQF